MPWLSLIPWKIVGIVVALISIWIYGYTGGIRHERTKQLAEAARNLEVAMAKSEQRYQVSLETERKNWESTNKIKEVTKVITKVIRDEKPSSSCNLSNGWVQRHNEASTNTIPEAARSDYEGYSGITADQALEGITENYGTCYEIRQIASDCQGWIKGQLKLNNGN